MITSFIPILEDKLAKIKKAYFIKISEDLDIKLNQINNYLIKAKNVLNE